MDEGQWRPAGAHVDVYFCPYPESSETQTLDPDSSKHGIVAMIPLIQASTKLARYYSPFSGKLHALELIDLTVPKENTHA